MESVEWLDGQGVVTPRIPALNVERWANCSHQVGHGYRLDLEQFDCGWQGLARMRGIQSRDRRFYESPALIGCALAVSRELYAKLWGFDAGMRTWGVEDLDFGLKCWLMGHPILHDPEATIGHRFRQRFDNYSVPIEHLAANQLRMARKNFTPGVWSAWLDRCRQRHPGRLEGHPEGLWARVWQLFEENRPSVERERAYLMAHRQRDEFWYAERFGLPWPRLESEPSAALLPLPLQVFAEPSPSPPPCKERCTVCGSGLIWETNPANKPAELDKLFVLPARRTIGPHVSASMRWRDILTERITAFGYQPGDFNDFPKEEDAYFDDYGEYLMIHKNGTAGMFTWHFVIVVDFCHLERKCLFGMKEKGAYFDWNPQSGAFDIFNEAATAADFPDNGTRTFYSITDPATQPKDYATIEPGADTVSYGTLKVESGGCDRRLVQADCPTIALTNTMGRYQSIEQLLKVADSEGVVSRYHHRFFMSIKPGFNDPIFRTEGLKKIEAGEPDPF